MTDNKNDYYDRTLIRLKRQYSKDETVAALSKKLLEKEDELSKLKIELSELNSYIEKLENEKKKRNLKNGGEVWFNKYNKLKRRFDELNYKIKK